MSGPLKITDEQLATLVALAPRLHRGDRFGASIDETSDRIIPAAPADGLLIEQRPYGAIAVEPDGGHGPTLVVARNGELRPDDDEYGAPLPPPVERARTGGIVLPGPPAGPVPEDAAVGPLRWCGKCARYVPVDENEAPRHHAPDCPEYIPF